jgi:glycosyltransferase involved in cell wall biosynthesis
MAAPLSKTLPITVLIAAKDESANIAKCIRSVCWAQKIYVIDSNSTDDTARQAVELGAEVVQFAFQGGFRKKRQWALDTLQIETAWVLLLDADEEVPEQLRREIEAATSNASGPVAYAIRKGFHFLGKRFRYGGFSFAAVLLIQRGKAHFERLQEDTAEGLDMEIHERLLVDGPIGHLATPLIHDDFKSVESYIAKHNKYSTWEARLRQRFLATGRWGEDSLRPRLFGDAQQRRRFLKFLAVRVPCEPQMWFLYHYILRGGFLEGRRGYIASRIRSDYIAAVRAKVFELSLGKRLRRTDDESAERAE